MPPRQANPVKVPAPVLSIDVFREMHSGKHTTWQCQGGYIHALPFHRSAALSLDLPESSDRLQCENSFPGHPVVPTVCSPSHPQTPCQCDRSVARFKDVPSPVTSVGRCEMENVVGGLKCGFSSGLLILRLVLGLPWP